MRLSKTILCFVLFFCWFQLNAHNPEDFVISEIERGQLTFENETIAAEYGAALKRQRIRRLEAMPWLKKNIFLLKQGLNTLSPRV
jgi:hypothetical protein